ncbi:hypothetical protein C0989_010463 [Termitomyces sp. Mn162]|nr:hypothetical protein C0989_010463 [Termitomyces sp. Mn162]
MRVNDSSQLITQLRCVLTEPQLYQQLVCFKGSDAQALLDTFQLLLDTPQLDTQLRRSLVAATQRLSRKSGRYPICYELKGVKQVETEPTAAGGFADIYKAVFEGQVVCLKVIRLYQDSQLEHLLKQFSKEVILWGQLSHPNVLPMYGLYRFKNKLCLVAPWMENGDIRAYLQHNPKADRPSLCVDVARGLRYLHKKDIVHGDLKGVRMTGRACLSDFGISGVSDPDIATWTSQSSVASKGGSVRWQAPELLDMENDEAVKNSTCSDIYALGCVFYEIQRGSRPSRPAESDSAWGKWGLTEGFWALFEDCWKSNPQDRPNVEEVLQRLPAIHLRPNEKLTLEHILSPVYFRGRMSELLDETSKLVTTKLLDNVIHSTRLALSSTCNVNNLTAQFHAQENLLPSQLHSSVELINIPMYKDPLAQNTNPVQQPKHWNLNHTSSNPRLLSRPLKALKERLAELDRLKFFLATAPSRWDLPNNGDQPNNATLNSHDQSLSDLYPSLSYTNSLLGMYQGGPNREDPSLFNRFLLPSGEYISCVLWKGIYYITGRDIVRALIFRFEASGRPVHNMKKFEDGVISDLHNLRPGIDACLEETEIPVHPDPGRAKGVLLVSVPHYRLFFDALERDLKCEKMGQEPTTIVLGEPATSLTYTYNAKESLYKQFCKAQGLREGEGELEITAHIIENSRMCSVGPGHDEQHNGNDNTADESNNDELMDDEEEGVLAAAVLQAVGLGSSNVHGLRVLKCDDEKRSNLGTVERS